MYLYVKNGQFSNSVISVTEFTSNDSEKANGSLGIGFRPCPVFAFFINPIDSYNRSDSSFIPINNDPYTIFHPIFYPFVYVIEA